MSSKAGRRLQLYMTHRPGMVFCDAGGLEPGLETLEALARMQIAAARLGLQLQLCDCSPQLCAVISFAGLDAVLGAQRGTSTADR
jgi:hypothetical protein